MISIFRDDCLNIMPTLEPKTVSLLVADPPYTLHSSYDTTPWNPGNWRCHHDSYVDWTLAWLTVALPLIRDDGSLLIFGSTRNILAVGHAVNEANLHVINTITWFKPNANPDRGRKKLAISSEFIFWIKKGGKFYFDYEAMRDGDFGYDKLKKPGKQMRDVWSIPTARHEERHHPTQKPIPLMKRLILMACPAGGTVLDPFAGSGTTGVAAKSLGRSAVLIEKEPGHVETIHERLYEPPRARPKRTYKKRRPVWRPSDIGR